RPEMEIIASFMWARGYPKTPSGKLRTEPGSGEAGSRPASRRLCDQKNQFGPSPLLVVEPDMPLEPVIGPPDIPEQAQSRATTAAMETSLNMIGFFLEAAETSGDRGGARKAVP
ncbi:MAG: hypothetical protein LH617_03545, partial [Ramlibacter sp.]|nr:hypothetical protein [Ramlibacter sp.]